MTKRTIGSPRSGDIFGHPRGLLYLVFAEGCERFSFYGMQALLILYLNEVLLDPKHAGHVMGLALLSEIAREVRGPLSPQAFASLIFGLYASLVYVTPLLGGYLADRWVGRSVSIIAGASLMIVGHVMMTSEALFLLALICLIMGVGGIKGNIASQIGDLYAPDDPRRARAFQIFFIGINGGVLLAPLICGTLGEKIGWHWGFLAAAGGMVIGLATYVAGLGNFTPLAARSRPHEGSENPGYTRAEWQRMILLISLVPILALSTVCNFQFFNAYLVWARASYDFSIFGFVMPVTWLIAFASLVSITMIAGTVFFWRWWGARWAEPSEMGKIAVGSVLLTLAPLILMLAASRTGAGHRISLLWAAAFELVNDAGYANLVPVSYSLFAAISPVRARGTMLGICLLQFFFSNLIVGVLGGLLVPLGGFYFWMMHAGVGAFASALIILMWKLAARALSPRATF
jgi:POT family proton-dependent oligopeptide transporter